MRGRVVIVGAGIIGAACARTLARRGLDVTIIDRGAAAGGTSSSGEGNLLVSDKAPGAELELAKYSLGLWRTLGPVLAAETGQDFPFLEFECKGGIVAALDPQQSQALDFFAERQRHAGVDAQLLSVDEALCLEPELSPTITSAVYYPQDAQVQPTVATESFLASARAAGTRVLVDTVVTGPLLDAGGKLVGVVTSQGSVAADHVVVAAGPWSGAVAEKLGGTLSVAPRKGCLLVTARMPHRIFHKVYDADYVGAVGSDNQVLQTSTVIEATVAGTVLIGSSRQHVGFDADLDVEPLRAMAAKAVRLMPFLRETSVIRTYCGFRPFARDHVPVIGQDPRVAGLWYAAGHEGAGIGLAPATAEILAALICGEQPAVAAAPFAPGRASLTAAHAGTA